MEFLLKVGRSVVVLSVLFMATQCKKDDPVQQSDLVCGVTDPINHLKWLNDEFKLFVGGRETNGIVLYDYDGKQVIEVQNSLASSTNIHQYSCDGVKLDLQDPQAFKAYREKRREVKVLYGTKIWQ